MKYNSTLHKLRPLFTQNWQILLYIVVALFLRLWNFHNSLYFIYDQGRDAIVLQKIATGHPVLVGPTSGLGGFFLGPLWYYIGLPGYLLTGGNPYGICIWYIFISSLAVPLFWILAHRLFPKKSQKFWAVACAIFLAVIPGSIHASMFIWNPLLSVPLMSGVILCLDQAVREKKKYLRWLVAAFVLLALVLQSEFAYGVFFMPVLFLLLPWIHQQIHGKFDRNAFVKECLCIVMAMGVTAVPQILFELRNHFIMTQSLWAALHDSSQSVSWSELWADRPQQLFENTNKFLLENEGRNQQFGAVLVVLAAIGFCLSIFNKQKQPNTFLWKVVALFALTPYPFFLIWRGNHGYFFWYYLTAHFIFIVPLILRSLESLVMWRMPHPALKYVPHFIVAVVLSIWLGFSAKYWQDIVYSSDNNAGLAKIVDAVAQVYEWQKIDGLQNDNNGNGGTVRVYTANINTEQYDYVLGWYARAHQLHPASTTRTGQEKIWYVMIESRSGAPKIFFDPWYADATAGGVKTREEQIGNLTIETWQQK